MTSWSLLTWPRLPCSTTRLLVEVNHHVGDQSPHSVAGHPPTGFAVSFPPNAQGSVAIAVAQTLRRVRKDLWAPRPSTCAHYDADTDLSWDSWDPDPRSVSKPATLSRCDQGNPLVADCHDGHGLDPVRARALERLRSTDSSCYPSGVPSQQCIVQRLTAY